MQGIQGATLSIRDLAVTSAPREPLKLMTTRAYFDGSGKSHDPNTRTVVLAGYVGSIDVWEEFEARWESFKQARGIDFSHATELTAGRGEFSGYDIYERGGVRTDIVQILREFNIAGLRAVAHAVSMEAYRRLATAIPSPELICGDGCLTTLCDIVDPGDTLQLFYDRGEGFFTRLQNDWRDGRKRAADPRLNRLNVFAEVDDWRKYGAMQAADYLAYMIHKATGSAGVWPWRLGMATAGLQLSGKYYGAAELAEIEKRL